MKKLILLVASLVLVSVCAFAEDPGKKEKDVVPVGLVNEDGTVNWIPGQLKYKPAKIVVDGYRLPKELR